jgi:hypothetical protein
MFDKEEYNKVINIPLAVIIASFIIIIITTGITNTNGLSALIGGYIGLLIGMFFIIILNIPINNLLDLFPFCSIIVIVSLIIYYLYTYFDTISSGQISSYYGSFSVVSTIFLATQIIILFSAFLNASGDLSTKILSDRTFALLSLFAVINLLVVITLGIVLHFYSTQG